jgi:hypothetical protein
MGEFALELGIKDRGVLVGHGYYESGTARQARDD